MARIRSTLLNFFSLSLRHLSRECSCHENIDENAVTLRCEHDPDFFTTLGGRYRTLVMLVLCDCREYNVP
jgi:hypothetical protein